MSHVTLEINSIQQTFLMVNLLIHDFLHDFDLKNTSNVSRLKRSQKIFSALITQVQSGGGGMKGGAGEIYNFLRWVSGAAMQAPRSTRPAAWGLDTYDGEMVADAGITLSIFDLLLSEDFEESTPFLDEDLLRYINFLLGERWSRSRGDIIKEIRLVFNLVNDIILYTVGFLNTSTGYFFNAAVQDPDLYYQREEQVGVGGSRDLQLGGISPTIVSKTGSQSKSPESLFGSPSKSPESLFGSPSKSPESPSKSPESPSKSPESSFESNKTEKLTQQQKYNNYVSSFISAIDIFKFKASNEIEDKDNKKAYEIFLTNFSDVFKLVTQKYNTVDPFKILNSLHFKKILVVFLMVGENTDKSEILKGFLNNSLYSEKEKKINVGELIEKYKLNIKEPNPEEPNPEEPNPEEPNPKESKVRNLINFFETKIQKGGTREEELEQQNERNWKLFLTINTNMNELINELSSTIQNSIESLSLQGQGLDGGEIDVFVDTTLQTIYFNIMSVSQEIDSFIGEVNSWEEDWTGQEDQEDQGIQEDQLIKLQTTLGVLQEMRDSLTRVYEEFEILLKQNMETFRSIRQQVRAAVERNKQFQGSFDNLIFILNSFVTQNIEQLILIKDTYLLQIENSTNANNKQLQRIRSADLSPEEILLGNKINRCYAVGMFKFLGLLDINYETGGSLFFTDRMNDIINLMKQNPHDKYCKLLSLDFYILFKDRYTSDKLWNDFNNMTHKKFDWSDKGLGSGLDTQLINGVRKILELHSINYALSGIYSANPPIRNIINNAYTGLEDLNVSQKDNVLCPYASIVDAMPQCSYASANLRDAIAEKNMNFTITDEYYTYLGIIDGRDSYVNYVMQVTSPNGTINVTLDNINLETSTILQANSVYAALLQNILIQIPQMPEILPNVQVDAEQLAPLAVDVKNFWYNLLLNDEIFQGLANIGMRKGAGDFFQEVFATFRNNGGPEPNIVDGGQIYGLMGDRPSGVRCIFFNLLGSDGNGAINPNNISGYGTQGSQVIISAAPQQAQGGFKKTRRNKRKTNKNTRRNKRKRNKKTRKYKRKRNKKTRKYKRKRNKKTRRNKRKSNYFI